METCRKREVPCAVDTDSKKQRVDLKSSHNIEQLSLLQPPRTTTYSTNWAINNYETWRISRNERFPDEPVPDDLLWGGKEEDLNYWLCHYIVETRKNNAEMYPSRTLYHCCYGTVAF